MNFSTYDSALQVLVDGNGELITLKDQAHDWSKRRRKTLKLAYLYDLAGYPEFARRAAGCATWLQYDLFSDFSRHLSGANFCQLRLCPMCISRRAKKAAYQLSRVLDVVESRHEAVYLFLTLTLKSIPGEELSASLTQLTGAWNKLLQHRHVKRAIKGWFRAIEITRRPAGYHPHIHAVLAVEPGYLARGSQLYISHREWMERWRLALGVDYDPSVRIQVTKAKGQICGGRVAALEAAKYCVKDEDYISPKLSDREAVEILRTYTEALRGRRMTAFGGWLKEVARELKVGDIEGGDLVNVDDESIRADVAELIETYHWHFGAGDYVLTSRQVNPLKLQREG